MGHRRVNQQVGKQLAEIQYCCIIQCVCVQLNFAKETLHKVEFLANSDKVIFKFVNIIKNRLFLKISAFYCISHITTNASL